MRFCLTNVLYYMGLCLHPDHISRFESTHGSFSIRESKFTLEIAVGVQHKSGMIMQSGFIPRFIVIFEYPHPFIFEYYFILTWVCCGRILGLYDSSC